MRVAFAQNLWEGQNGPLLLAQVLESQGHEVRFFLPERGWFEAMARFRPRVLAVSLCTNQHAWALDVAARAKKALSEPPLVVFGGPHPTFFPEIISHAAVDAVCLGEGESSFPRLLAAVNGSFTRTDVENFWIKKDGHIFKNPLGPLIEDLDSLPIPSRKPLYDHYPFIRSSPFKKTVAGRGCPFNCNYCFNRKYRQMVKGKGPYVRLRSPEHLIEEIRYLKREFGLRFIDINDDIFTLDKDWLARFADLYPREAGVPFGCNVHVRYMDADVAEMLKQAGCSLVKFGLETANEKVRKDILNKHISNEDIRRCAAALRSRGIPFQTYNMLGIPWESMTDARETLHLNQEIAPAYAWSSLAQPYPGTRLAEMCLAQGMAGPENGYTAVSPSWFASSVLDFPHRRRMVNFQKFFAFLVRFPRLQPLAELLSRLPPNVFFRLFSQFIYGTSMRRVARTGRFRALRLFLKNRKHY
ncbi:MAG: radical SAM protein [Thermodesulfobacteriota bacterium]